MMLSIRLLCSSIALASAGVLLACQRPADQRVPVEGTRATPGEARVEWGMVIHGGAGTISRANMSPEQEREDPGSADGGIGCRVPCAARRRHQSRRRVRGDRDPGGLAAVQRRAGVRYSRPTA